jgi:hypothetical protein
MLISIEKEVAEQKPESVAHLQGDMDSQQLLYITETTVRQIRQKSAGSKKIFT